MPGDARFISPIDRVLYLRSAGFQDMAADDIYAIALRFRERFFKKGSSLLIEGEAASRTYMLVEGRVSLRRAGRTYRVIEPPGTVGLLAALGKDPAGVEARAELDCLTLEWTLEDVLDTFEDSFTLMSQMIRQLARQVAELQRKLELAHLLPRDEPIQTPYPERPLDLVQRLVLLSRSGPFKSGSLNALTEIAERGVEVRVEPGTTLWREGDHSDYGVNILHGIVSCVGDGGKRRFRMGPGSVLGTLETLGRLPRSYDAVAETRLVLLRGDFEVFFDVMEDNLGLGQAFLSFLANVLDKLYERASVLTPVTDTSDV